METDLLNPASDERNGIAVISASKNADGAKLNYGASFGAKALTNYGVQYVLDEPEAIDTGANVVTTQVKAGIWSQAVSGRPMTQEEEKRIHSEFKLVSKAAISFLRQKVKINWLKDGDDNTRMFRQAIKQRSYRNRIISVKDERGIAVSSQNEIFSLFVRYYKMLWSRKQHYHRNHGIVEADTRLNTEQQLKLMAPFSDAEVTEDLGE
ncbi:hypothetical protein RIF29_38092 [Crotalaria pallida]|uniref:Uncharacterized protein n=1 Tax=Crotalaria pallida TaxID=3830 RepID=A0AAN9HNG3_CROPI